MVRTDLLTSVSLFSNNIKSELPSHKTHKSELLSTVVNVSIRSHTGKGKTETAQLHLRISVLAPPQDGREDGHNRQMQRAGQLGIASQRNVNSGQEGHRGSALQAENPGQPCEVLGLKVQY